ncbi:MAG: hypothetical protein LBP73_05000 [Clostridiales Family XIII bacterium]|jgi:shikimate dehydrogenase|nr:hypothetical protein [Clostridiales Family XIII bacterium]
MRLKYTVHTKLYFLIGDPMDHACSPYVNNMMYEYANLDAVCIPAVVPKGKLEPFISAVRLMNLPGFYLTMPHKTDIIEYLDDAEEMSLLFNSVNHVRNDGGKLVGIGLDGVGQAANIERAAGGPGSLADKKALILGAGSVAGPIAGDLCKRGIKKFAIANRTVEKARAVVAALKKYDSGVTAVCGPLHDGFLSEAARDADVVAQCTSLGLAGGCEDYDSLDFMKKLPSHCIAADVLYPTSGFLETARTLGLRRVDGTGMSLMQQKEIMKFQFGIDLPDSFLFEGEEAFATAVALRDLRLRRNAGA